MVTVIVRWCDLHLVTDERVPGEVHTLNLDGRSGTIDLCPDHAKTVLGPLLDILAPDPGQRRGGGRRPEPGDAPCVLCDRTFRGDRLAAHVSKQHGTTLAATYGTTCPLCDAGPFVTPPALGSHARSHGLGSVGDLWAQVVRDGDPQGRLAALRARVA